MPSISLESVMRYLVPACLLLMNG